MQLEDRSDYVLEYGLIKNGEKIGVLLIDLYYRPKKHKHTAWMESYNYSAKALGINTIPYAKLNLNCTANIGLDLDELNTILHELGHCMHHIMSKVQWPSISGVSIESFAVELPSQLFESF